MKPIHAFLISSGGMLAVAIYALAVFAIASAFGCDTSMAHGSEHHCHVVNGVLRCH